MEFVFKLSEQEANTIIQALQELPAKLANPLTKKLMDQAKEQMSDAEVPQDPSSN